MIQYVHHYTFIWFFSLCSLIIFQTSVWPDKVSLNMLKASALFDCGTW